MNFYNRKKGLDQYFTSNELADKLVKIASKYVANDNTALFIEPSAGTGQIVKALKKASYNNIIAIEIDPILAKKLNFICSDYLEWTPQKIDKHIIVIGNPPFTVKGKRYMVQKFINHSLSFANLIIFIVPVSMTIARHIERVDRIGHLIENVLFRKPVEFITKAGKTKSIKIAIQVWKKQNNYRSICPFINSTPDFIIPFVVRHKFNKYKQCPDILIRSKGCLKDVGQLIFAKCIDPVAFDRELKRLKHNEKGWALSDFFIIVTNKNAINAVVKKIQQRQKDFYIYLQNSSTGNLYNLNRKEFISIYTHGIENYIYAHNAFKN